MIDNTLWQPLIDELDRWHASGRQVRFWLRDDDAVAPTAALDRLLSLGRNHPLPMMLAVIPAFAETALARRLKDEDAVSIAVHGWSHENHAPETEKKQELGSHRPVEVVLAELRSGFEKLQNLFGAHFAPVLVPPWNRIAAPLLQSLSPIGFEALSVYGRAKASMPIRLLNTHVDIIDWHGTRGGLDHRILVSDLIKQLQQRADGDDEPIGILTHHLVHDDGAWSFLEALCEKTADHPAVLWSSIADLLETSRS